VPYDAEANVERKGARIEGRGSSWISGEFDVDAINVLDEGRDLVPVAWEHWGDASGTRRSKRCAVERDGGFGWQAGADEPEGVVGFQAGRFVEDPRPTHDAVRAALALPGVAEAEGVGEEHGLFSRDAQRSAPLRVAAKRR
jgi:hypothetical protein